MLKRENLNNGLDTRFTTCVNVRQLTSRDVVDTRNEKKRSLALVLLQIDDNQNITSGFPFFFPSPALNGHRPKTKPKTVFFTIIDSKGQRNSRRKGFFLFKSSSLSISKRFICFLSLSLFLLWQHFVSETLCTWPGTLSVQSDWAVEFRFVYFDRMFNIHNLLVSKNIQQVKVWKVLFGVDLSAWRRPTRKRKETPLPSWMVNKRGQLLFPSAAIH